MKTWHDWGETAAFLAVLGLAFATGNRYTLGGSEMTLALTLLLAFCCGVSVWVTLAGRKRMTRIGMLTVAAILTLVLAASLSRIVYLVVFRSSSIDGTRLLATALFIWTSNVVLFAVLYRWTDDAVSDFMFPGETGTDPRHLVFLDYLFLSFTTATAFSPTDTPPLTTRARMLMMVESSISLATIAIAAARAVNILH